MKVEHNFKMICDDDLFTSVFNLNNKEEKKAKECFKIIYGYKQLKELEEFIKDRGGLMAIFDEEQERNNKMINEAKKRLLARKVNEVLTANILERYDNYEYYDFELDAIADILIGLSEQDKTEVLRLVK
jgi:hypothetical protein